MEDSVTQLKSLYEAHALAILRYLRGVTGNSELAEDLMQETFAKAVEHMGRLDEIQSPRAWLYAIARNLNIAAHRRRRAHDQLSVDVAADSPAEEDPRLQRMRQAIAFLPDKPREALELRLRDQLSYEDIAHVLDVPVGTVRSRIHHAIRKLRERLVDRDEIRKDR